nr:hypothetical protein [Tanacetum cinerariifolium]
MDLELTIISAKHLKNVNWRNGDLTPYVIFWLEPNHKLATKSDDSNNTKPVWNERFIIPVQPGPNPTLYLEVFHSKPSDTNKPLVGSLRVPLYDVINDDDDDDISSFDLKRPSGRVNGKIRLKMSMRQRVDVNNYQIAPQHGFYYTNAPPPNYGQYPPYNTSPSPSVPPSPVTAPSQNSYNYRSSSDPYSGYYHGGYYAPPPPQQQTPHRPGGYGGPSAPVPTQWPVGYGGSGGGAGPNAPVDYVKLPPPPLPPHMPRTVDGYCGGGGAGPSAPVDYAQYDQKQKSGKLGLGLGVGGVIGGMSGLSIDEGSRYEEEKVVESELNVREMDDYRRRVDY